MDEKIVPVLSDPGKYGHIVVNPDGSPIAGAPFVMVLVYGTSGNANGELEYFAEAHPGTETTDAKWRARKFIYDSNQNVINILWADGNSEFNNQADDLPSLSYF